MEIISLETRQEEAAAQHLSVLIDEARETKDPALIRRIRRCWRQDRFGHGRKHGERWASIKKKLAVEGSTWYVWWMDGVRAFMQMNKKKGAA